MAITEAQWLSGKDGHAHNWVINPDDVYVCHVCDSEYDPSTGEYMAMYPLPSEGIEYVAMKNGVIQVRRDGQFFAFIWTTKFEEMHQVTLPFGGDRVISVYIAERDMNEQIQLLGELAKAPF